MQLVCMPTVAQISHLLTGEIIGTEQSVDYTTFRVSQTVNTRECAFDGRLDTYFASYERSRTWVGLDLGTKHVITKVKWSPRDDSYGPRRVQLALFEGANSPDFMDALPLYLIQREGTIGVVDSAEVCVSRGFRYVRYVGPADARCNVAEVAFYGYENEGNDSLFYQITNLPTMSIHVEEGEEPYDKEHQLPSRMLLVYDGGTRLQDYPVLTRLRGNASMDFPKKPYRVKFNDGKKHHMLKGSPQEAPAKAKKWTLINNYGDKTLMRNMVAFDLSRRMGMAYTPWCQPVDVIVNGEYRGNYQLADQIEVRENRVDIEELTPDAEDISGGYLIESDGYYYKEPAFIWTGHNNVFVIKSPDDSITVGQKNYIESFWNTMENRLYASSDGISSAFRACFDVHSFLQYFLVNELAGNPDIMWSTFFYKDKGDNLLYTGPVWDFDIAFDNDVRVYPVSNRAGFLYTFATNAAGNMRDFFHRVLSDQYVSAELKDRWVEARRHAGVTEEVLCTLVDSIAYELDEAQRLNFLRWNTLNSRVHQNPRVWGSYDAEVEALKDFLCGRIEWMDKKMGYDAGADGMENIFASFEQTERMGIYTLSGQKMNVNNERLLPKGLYIIDGKKKYIR